MTAKPRAREVFKDLNYFTGKTGPHNAITDVPGVTVGYANVRKFRTTADGKTPDYKLQFGEGPAITGVTAILPRPKDEAPLPVLAGLFSFNGNGELTGSHWIEEAGQWDGWLSDINGFHVKPEHVFEAIDSAKGGPVAEGSMGGGSGMVNYEFKGGSGTSSRVVDLGSAGVFTVGVFVQANFGRREQLVIAGVPVGKKFPLTGDANPYSVPKPNPKTELGVELGPRGNGSIIAILATDAPLVPHQLKRLARRIPMGIARTGTSGDHGSGDIFLAFTTANKEALASDTEDPQVVNMKVLPDKFINPMFEAVAEVVEEAILNVLCAGETTTGRDGHVVPALPIDSVLQYMKSIGRDQWK
ncbi:hypothetical protein HDU93_001114 [Gonapodya sp. JEL0774]|nr:hypothetical protein HDU93_001114 [Gonapodya sp. JEL0774]